MPITAPPWPTLFRRAGDHALQLLFPPICAACSADIEASSTTIRLCRTCVGVLPLVREPVCPRCALPIPSTAGVDLECPHCARQPLGFDRTFAVGWYDGLLRNLVLRMKTDNRGLVAAALADLTVKRLEDRPGWQSFDMVLPAPMHWRREWQRGVNASALFSAALARRLEWPLRPRLLRRRRHAPRQAGLSRQGRFRNVRREIEVSRRRTNLRGARVLLVDDVMTTGATSSESARALKKAGAKDVAVLVIARAKGN